MKFFFTHLYSKIIDYSNNKTVINDINIDDI